MDDTLVLKIPEAQALSDLAGVMCDLQRCIVFAELLQKKYYDDMPTSDALNTAVLIRYARSFAEGVRASLYKDASAVLTKAELKDHQDFIALRNKHIAHSVNAFEHNECTVKWTPGRPPASIISIGLRSERIMALSPHDLQKLIQLAKRWLSHVEARISAEEERLLRIVAAMSGDDLARLPRLKNNRPSRVGRAVDLHVGRAQSISAPKKSRT